MDAETLAMAKAYSDSKGGYAKPGEVLAKVNLEPDDLTGAYNFIDGKIGLEVGNTYTVTTDSGKYSCVCQEYDGDIYIGNHDVLDGVSDSGERFCICEYSETEGGETVWFTDFCDLDGGKTIAVSSTETIVPIDPKFLPGVCLPVVEITSEVAEGTIFNETESAALDAACGSPAIIKHGNSMLLAEYAEADGMQIFSPVSSLMSGYMFAKTEGMWVAMQTEL